MPYTITTHKIAAIIGFLILASVQFFLVYNTYQLKDEKYFQEEKQLLDKEYAETIRTDIVFPGGQKIMDRYIWDNRTHLERLYHTNPDSFYLYKQKICGETFTAFRRESHFDSIFNQIIHKHQLRSDLKYVLFVNSIEISFENNQYVPLFSTRESYTYLDTPIIQPYGAQIAGTLQDVNKHNKVTSITVSSTYKYNCRLTFSLHVDLPNRQLAVMKQMLGPFCLLLFSVLVMAVIYYVTFRNWIRQKKLSEMKTDFINGITHEFHTPISAILVANKVLLKEDVNIDRETTRSMLQLVNRQAERLQHLVKRVLDITTTNQLKLQKELHPLHHIVEEIMMAYRLKYSGNNLQLDFRHESACDDVLLDRFWFTTLLLNILENAVKYNDKPVKRITIHTASDKKNIYLSITDNGLGMSKESQQHIFDKFYRHKQHRNTDIMGLGLGLYYVKQAVEAHQWKIQVESEPGTGTTFTVIIPIHTLQTTSYNLTEPAYS